MTTLEEGLISYLSSYATLTALISTRVYLMRIPQDATLPCLVVQRISTPRMLTMDSSGATGDLAYPRFQFDAWADLVATAKPITDAVRAALNGKTGTMGGVTIRAALVDEEVPEFDPGTKLYRSRSDYIIWQQE